jgi:hypothetical protein
LRAMAEAARWPRPGTMLAALRNIIEVQERDCDCDSRVSSVHYYY